MVVWEEWQAVTILISFVVFVGSLIALIALLIWVIGGLGD